MELSGGTTMVRWYGPEAIARMRLGAAAGLEAAASLLLRRSLPLVPWDTRQLRYSGSYVVDRTNLTAGVGYSRPDEPGAPGRMVTIVQHEDTTLNHPRGGQAKYLEQPFKQSAQDLLNRIGEGVKAALR